MRLIYYGLTVVIIVFGVTFSVLNAAPVTVNYYFGQNVLPLSLLLVITLLLGSLLGLIIGIIMVLNARCENRRLRRKIVLIEAEVANLRALPIQDTP